MRQDLRMLEKRYGKAPSGLSKSQGRVIVIDEQGVVEALQGWRIDLPIYDSRATVRFIRLRCLTTRNVEHSVLAMLR